MCTCCNSKNANSKWKYISIESPAFASVQVFLSAGNLFVSNFSRRDRTWCWSDVSEMDAYWVVTLESIRTDIYYIHLFCKQTSLLRILFWNLPSLQNKTLSWGLNQQNYASGIEDITYLLRQEILQRAKQYFEYLIYTGHNVTERVALNLDNDLILKTSPYFLLTSFPKNVTLFNKLRAAIRSNLNVYSAYYGDIQGNSYAILRYPE